MTAIGAPSVSPPLRAGALIVAVAAYTLAVLTAIDTEWVPLIDDGAASTVLVLSAGVALGFLWGRWWAVLAAPLFLIAHAALDWDAVARALSVSHLPRNYYWPTDGFWITLGSGAFAATIALGVVLRRLARRSSGRSRVIERAAIAIALLVLVAVTVASLYSQARTRLPIDIAPDSPARINERVGEIGGVKMGSEAKVVRARFGVPRRERVGFLRYRTITFFLSDSGKVRSFVVDNQSAETMLGVNVGDSLNLARERYPTLHCERQSFHDGGETGDPSCESPRHSDVHLSFWGNPIESIAVRGGRRG